MRSFPSNGRDVVIRKLDPVLNGWCTCFGSEIVTGRFTRWIGLFGVKCSYGFDASTSAAGERLERDGTTASFTSDVDSTRW